MTTDVHYLDAVTASEPGRRYKDRLLTLLDVRPGQTVLDVGCGPGGDLAVLAGLVEPGGVVVGVDADPAMVATARRRLPGIDVRIGAAEALPLLADSVDRARADRVLQHVADPVPVFGEFARVLRPGGRLALAEPDWESLVVDSGAPDTGTAASFARYLAGRPRNGTIGRALSRLSTDAGFSVDTVEPSAVCLVGWTLADQVLGLRRNTARAVRDGAIEWAPARRWLDDLATGPVLATVTIYLVTARAS